MLRFLVRRLLLALPTLLGICLVTFALTHLAPGDPLAGGLDEPGRASASARASARRLYFLDLPLFVNLRPRGLEARTERLLAGLAGVAGESSARGCGTVCLADFAAAHARSSGETRARLGRVLAAIRAEHAGLAPGSGPLEGWLGRALPALEPAALARLAAGLGHDPAAAAALAARGSAALTVLLPVIAGGDEAAADAASEAASRLTGIEGRLAGLPAGERRARLESWSEWWYRERREHVRFTPGERLLGHVTETQFGKWLGRLLTLRLGTSLHDGRPVAEKLGEALPITLLLSFLAMAIGYLVAVPLGVHAAVRQGTILERSTTFLLFVLYSLPSFWVAMVLILLFGGVGYLSWFPIYGLASPGLEDAGGWTWFADRLHHLVLPVACLSYGSIAVISRYQRGAMLEVLRQDYIRTARAKGLPERAVIFRHALRNALLPTITLLGLQLPFLVGGSVVVEKIFNIPGMGLLAFQAFLHRDYPVIMAVAVLSAALTLAGLILADLCYALVDPRISLERER
jgi:peptide/nickel transport system permease protein